MSAAFYRDELEALLKRAEKDGYKFNVELDVDAHEYSSVETEYFFMNVHDYRDHAGVDAGLIWETEL